MSTGLKVKVFSGNPQYDEQLSARMQGWIEEQEAAGLRFVDKTVHFRANGASDRWVVITVWMEGQP